MQCHHSSEASTTKALSVALQHPAVASDQQIICRLLQVCKAWRTAIRQSNACLTDIKFISELCEDSDLEHPAMEITPLLSQFAHWLSIHASIVRSVEFSIKGFEVEDGVWSPTLRDHAHDLIALGLRAAGRPMTAAEFNSSAFHKADAMLPRPLQLQSFKCCSAMASPSIVSALPAATLTRLEMKVPKSVQVHKALRSLSNLKSLNLNSGHEIFSCVYLSSINQLSGLTDLTLDSIPSSGDLTSLPQHLSHLSIRIDKEQNQAVNLAISHLTDLQQLRADLWCDIEAASLPSHLQKLNVDYGAPVLSALDIRSMHQLQQLELGNSQEAPGELISLNQLQQLTSIVLQYNDGGSAVAAAPVWSQLQHLSALELRFNGSAVQMASVMDACCQLTRLTELCWELTLDADAAADVEIAQNARTRISDVCQLLKHLTNLKKLEIDLKDWVEVQPNNMLHLCSLTGLTYLWLRVGNLGSSTSTIAVLLELTQLQDLTLAGLVASEVLPVVGQLKQLTHLHLWDSPKDLQPEALKYLTKLRNLQELEGFDSCNRKHMKQFWADLRG